MGRGSAALAEAARSASLITTDRVIEEVSRRLALGLGRPELLEPLARLCENLTIIPLTAIGDRLLVAEQTLKNAVQSRNGSSRDTHGLALAWAAGADVWSADRDFAGTGVPSWSTANLLRALPLEGLDSRS
jgi:predicted nucleic acid-binding protein